MTLSIITPFFNEESNLPAYRERLLASLQEVSEDIEIVLVDDHSADGGPTLAKNWLNEDPRVTYLRLSRNCGAHAAIAAGLAHCQGDYAIIVAADLQDPPEAIPQLLEKLKSGYDIVWGVRSARPGDALITRFLSSIYYRVTRCIALPEMHAQGVDLISLNRRVISAYNAASEKHSSLVPTLLWMGFNQGEIEIVRPARLSGRSKWTLAKRTKLFIDTIVSFSYLPIRLMSLFGLIMALAGFGFAATVIFGRIMGWVTTGTGYAALMTTILIGQGSIMVMLGVLGEYLWRTFDETRKRAPFIIEESCSRRLESKLKGQ